jgi:thiamine-monophosphate kinase
MQMARSFEEEFISWLMANLPINPNVALGIGDDAAVLKMTAGSNAVVTTDLLTDHVDFLLDQVDPLLVGHKALGVNLSDLAAMAAEPVGVVVSLAMPRRPPGGQSQFELATALYGGMINLAQESDVVILGGDTNIWDGPLAISITAIGKTTEHGPLTRSGGRPGDAILATGRFGGSILGRHLKVQPRIREALLLHAKYRLHAGIDVSDGLALDTWRLAQASGSGAILELASIPITREAEQLAAQDGQTPLEHALADGEDFELLLAVPPDEASRILEDQPLQVAITQIGQLTANRGLWQQDQHGKQTALAPRGWLHG